MTDLMERGAGSAASRTAPRLKLFQPTRIEMSDTAARAHLLNLSTGGALLHAQDAPRAGSVIRVDCAGRTMTAEVRWVRDRRFGVQFSLPLTPAEVDAAVHAGTAGGTADAAKR